MTKARWSPDEDLLLVKQVLEKECDFDSFIHLFPERDKYAIIKRFKRLEEKANEQSIPLMEFVEQNAKSNVVDSIKSILCTQTKKSRILEKILQISNNPSDTIRAILILAKENDLLCIKLALIFKYLIEKFRCQNFI